jgi:hypothetical protein
VLHKHGKWYADWEDHRHARKRKAFKTKKQALRFQQRMREESAAKKARASGPSSKSAKPGARRATSRQRSASPPSSPSSAARSPRTKSPRSTSNPSTHGGGPA